MNGKTMLLGVAGSFVILCSQAAAKPTVTLVPPVRTGQAAQAAAAVVLTDAEIDKLGCDVKTKKYLKDLTAVVRALIDIDAQAAASAAEKAKGGKK